MRSKKEVTKKAESYGYSDEKAKKIGAARSAYTKGQSPVAKETNKKMPHTKIAKPSEKDNKDPASMAMRKDDVKAKDNAKEVVKLGHKMEKHEMKELKHGHAMKHEHKLKEHHKEAKHHMHKLEHHLKKMEHHHEKMSHHEMKKEHHKGKK